MKKRAGESDISKCRKWQGELKKAKRDRGGIGAKREERGKKREKKNGKRAEIVEKGEQG